MHTPTLYTCCNSWSAPTSTGAIHWNRPVAKPKGSEIRTTIRRADRERNALAIGFYVRRCFAPCVRACVCLVCAAAVFQTPARLQLHPHGNRGDDVNVCTRRNPSASHRECASMCKQTAAAVRRPLLAHVRTLNATARRASVLADDDDVDVRGRARSPRELCGR